MSEKKTKRKPSKKTLINQAIQSINDDDRFLQYIKEKKLYKKVRINSFEEKIDEEVDYLEELEKLLSTMLPKKSKDKIYIVSDFDSFNTLQTNAMYSPEKIAIINLDKMLQAEILSKYNYEKISDVIYNILKKYDIDDIEVIEYENEL